MKRIIALCIATSFMIACIEEKSTSQPIDAKEVPEVVRGDFKRNMGGVENATWEKEGENFEVSYEYEGKEQGLIYNAEGVIIEKSKEIEPGRLPQAIIGAVEQLYPNAKIISAEAKASRTSNYYEVELKQGNEEIDLVFDENGALLTDEKIKIK